jgi:hypothetical protein
MADINSLKDYLENSISSPLLNADPVYIDLQTGGIETILNQVVKSRGYTISNLPSIEEDYVILLAKKEIYLRLATTMAPEYNLEQEFTKILKSQRFDHYMKLLTFIQKDIDNLVESGIFSTVQYSDVVIDGRNGFSRNYSLATSQEVQLDLSAITATSVNLDWNIFDTTVARFYSYDIFYSEYPIYDPYSSPAFVENARLIYTTISDIKRVKYRLTDLNPGTIYYIVLVFNSTNGNQDIYSTTFTTLDE